MDPELSVSGTEVREAVLTSLARFGGGIHTVSVRVRPENGTGCSARIAVKGYDVSFDHEHFGRSVRDAVLSALSRAARTMERRARLGDSVERETSGEIVPRALQTAPREPSARAARRASRRVATAERR